jgi:cation diffusion facilitator CzcD-associated flavoprotein CzcO
MVGCGVTGIAAVKLYKDAFPEREVELVIYEKNDDITGTWLENRYPGCACDVPAHAYSYSWEGNPRWSRVYVGAEELYDYFKGRAAKYGVDEFVKLNHHIQSATWDDELGKWVVNITNLKTGESIRDEAELFIYGAGFLNNWKWPEIPGLHDFKGKLLHSARWDDSYDFKDKKVAVIGSGSSAIQIVPQLQPVVKHMTSINRSKAWITPEFAAEFAPEGRAAFFSEIQKDNWEKNKDEYLKYRKSVESTMNNFFPMQFKDSDLQKAAHENFQKTMKERLGYNEDLINKLVPDFEVGCRRITPGHGYLEALASHNVSVRSDNIEAVTAEGLKMADGSIIAVDALICATGFDTSYRPNFPVIGFNGDLRDVWKEEPRAYFSLAAAGVPNYFVMSGPNFPLANGCLIPCLETNIKFAFAAAKKIQYDGIKWLSPKQEAVDDYQEYKDSIMEDLVWTGSCSSWYKNGQVDGKVWGPYSGSSLHYLELMSKPRWEDFDIEYLVRNRYDFLGNGRTRRELEGWDLAYYVQEPGAGSGQKSS